MPWKNNTARRAHTTVAPFLAGLLLTTMLFLTGCGSSDFRPNAIGAEGEIYVVIDSVQWQGTVGEALRNQLGEYIRTLPAVEPIFDLKPVHLTSTRMFEQIKEFKNLVFAAPLSDTTNEAKFLNSLLSDEAKQAIFNGGNAVVPRSNVWRRRQQVFYLTAATPEALTEAIEQEGENILFRFNEVTRQRVHRQMFEKGRQPDIEATLMEKHGFAVNAQHDYQIAIDTTNFVWLRRILPDTRRSLFVYYEEQANPADLTPEWVYATRDSLTRRYVQGSLWGTVTIDRRRPLESSEINFKNRYALESRGLWVLAERTEDGRLYVDGGGPFLTYAFYDQPSGRLYMIDGMVFAPGFSKREFLRQMEVIAYTFRTREEVEQEQQLALRD
ncbi:MAG: DUF4837 family protein [Rhodothermales bacterium]